VVSPYFALFNVLPKESGIATNFTTQMWMDWKNNVIDPAALEETKAKVQRKEEWKKQEELRKRGIDWPLTRRFADVPATPNPSPSPSPSDPNHTSTQMSPARELTPDQLANPGDYWQHSGDVGSEIFDVKRDSQVPPYSSKHPWIVKPPERRTDADDEEADEVVDKTIVELCIYIRLMHRNNNE
jgi:hypothetical protein